MTKTYCTNGKPLDILKREAKALSKDEGIKLGQAHDKVARAAGFSNWQDLVEKCLKVEEPDLGDMPFITRRIGRDQVIFEIMSPDDFEDNTGDVRDDAVAPLFIEVSLLVGYEENTVKWEVRLLTQSEAFYRGVGVCLPFTPRVGHDRDTFLEALENAADLMPGDLFSILNQDGFFDIDLQASLRNSEHEALLILEARKLGLDLGDRTTFNADIGVDKVDYEVSDWYRRCFANLLSDGSVIVSNGAQADALRWKVLPKEEFEALKADMEADLGEAAYTTQQGEIWMHDRVLAQEPALSPET